MSWIGVDLSFAYNFYLSPKIPIELNLFWFTIWLKPNFDQVNAQNDFKVLFFARLFEHTYIDMYAWNICELFT